MLKCIIDINWSPFCFSGCFSMQSFKEEPTYTEVNPGENTELRCVVNDIGGECRWQKDGKVSNSMARCKWSAWYFKQFQR